MTVNSSPVLLTTAVRNVVANWAGYLFIAGVNFFLAPFVLRRLGVSGYAVWSLIISITGYLGLLDLGVRSAVTRFVARHQVRSEHNETSRIVSSAALFFTLSAGLAIIASAFISIFLIERFDIPPEYRASARIVIVLIGSSIGTSLIGGVFGGILVGLQRFDIVNLLQALNTALR